MAVEQQIKEAKLEKIPIKFQLGDNFIDGAIVRPLSFRSFADCILEAHGMTQPAAFEARLRRIRMVKQVQYFINGTVVPVSAIDVLKLPVADTHKIIAKLDENEGRAGKIVRDGDGINQAITYELGTPILTGKEPITELEFYASTYGDIEDMLAGDTAIQQTNLLIRTVAKPLGHTIQRLTEGLVNQITVADGVTISNLVLPRFLGSPSA